MREPSGLSTLAARGVAAVGRAASWLILFMVLTTFLVVTLRYGFSKGWVWMQETVTYLHAAVFMLAAAWTWQDDGHVRVDIFYRDRPERHKAWVNLLGTMLFVVPVASYLLLMSWDYVAASWSLREGSREAGGLGFVYLLKTLLIAMPALLLVQGACVVTASLRSIRGRERPAGA